MDLKEALKQVDLQDLNEQEIKILAQKLVKIDLEQNAQLKTNTTQSKSRDVSPNIRSQQVRKQYVLQQRNKPNSSRENVSQSSRVKFQLGAKTQENLNKTSQEIPQKPKRGKTAQMKSDFSQTNNSELSQQNSQTDRSSTASKKMNIGE